MRLVAFRKRLNIEKNYEEGDERESIFNDIPALDEKRKTEEKQT